MKYEDAEKVILKIRNNPPDMNNWTPQDAWYTACNACRNDLSRLDYQEKQK